MPSNNHIQTDSVKKNIAYQSVYQILSLILPFITAPYISRVLGSEGTGIYSYANSIMYFFLMGANLGILNYGNREIASCIHDRELLSTKFWEIFFCHLLTTTVSMIAYFCYFVFFSGDYKYVFIWQSFQLLAAVCDITWFFAGIQKFKVTVIRNFIIRTVSVISVFVFIKEPGDVWKYVLINAGGNFVGQFIVWTQLRQYIDAVPISFRNVIRHLKPLIILFIPGLAVSIYRYMDKVMIPSLSNVSELGLYENTEKIVTLPLSLITSIGVVLLSKMSNIVSEGKKGEAEWYFNLSLKYSLIFAFGLTGGLIGVAPVFAPVFFGEEFRACGTLIPMLAITFVFLTVSNTIILQYLVPNKNDKAYIIATFSGAFVNLIVNVLLIPVCGAKGAVIATVLTELIVVSMHIFFTHKHLDFKGIFQAALPFAFPSVIMILMVRQIGSLLGESVMTIIIQVLLGAMVYGVSGCFILYMQKDTYFMSLIDTVKAKTGRN